MIKNFVKPGVKYGVLLSGGLDSAVLLCLMIKDGLSQGFVPDIKIFTIPKHDGAQLYIADIILFISQRFAISLPTTVLVGNPDVYHRIQSSTAILDIFKKYPEVDYVVLGTNQNPPIMIEGTAPDRVTQSEHPKILLPFIDLYKNDILSLMYQESLTGLIGLTHSCTEQQVGRCNRCFQCNERAWAFNQLNKTDIGLL